MFLLDNIKQQVGEALKFFKQNPTVFSAIARSPIGQGISNVTQQIDQRLSGPVQPGQAKLSDIAKPAYQVGKFLTTPERAFGKDVAYYGMGQSNSDVAQQTKDVEGRSDQAQIARRILQQNPNVPNRDYLLGIINNSSQKDPYAFTPEGVSKKPKEIAANAAETFLDVATAGTMSAGMKQAAKRVPQFARYIGAGAGLGASYGGVESLREDLSLPDAAKKIGLYSAGGAVLASGLFGAGQIVNRLANRRRIYKAIEKSGQNVDDILEKTAKTYSAEIGRDAIDDAAVQIQYKYGDNAKGYLEELAGINPNVYDNWDELTRDIVSRAPNKAYVDDVMNHITTRRLYSADPDFMAQFVKKNVNLPVDDTKIKASLEDLFEPVRTRIQKEMFGTLPNAGGQLDVAARKGTQAIEKATEPIAKAIEPAVKELDPLVTEARKYKSADEFVKAQTNSYHGTSDTFTEFKLQNGRELGPNAIFVSPQQDVASYYSQGIGKGGKGKVVGVNLSEAKLFDYKNSGDITKLSDFIDKNYKSLVDANTNTDYVTKKYILDNIKRGDYSWIEKPQFQDYFKKAGYDGFKIRDYTGGDGIGIFDVSKLKTESQLTDIWNQANKPVEGGIPKGSSEAFGAVAGIETDDQGNVRYNPIKGAVGIVAGTAARKSGIDTEQIMKRFDSLLSTDVNKVIKETVKNSGYEKKVVTWDETRKLAEEIGLDPAALSKKKADKLSGSEMLAIRDIISQNADFVVSSQKKLLDQMNPLNESEAADLDRKIQLAMGQNEDLMDKFLVARSQAGRDLNNLKILANRSMDPANWLATARRATGEDRLPEDVQKKIYEFTNSNDRIGLVNYIASLQKSTLGEKATTLWKAGLLTKPGSQLVNIMGNSIMSVMETAKDVPATMADWALGNTLGKGQRTKVIAPIQKGLASLEGTTKGLKLAAKYLKTGIDPDEMLTKWDLPKRMQFKGIPFVSKALQTYTDVVFRSLGAADKVFRYKMIQRVLAEEAITGAKQLLKEGKIPRAELKSTVQQLYKNPTADMEKAAIDAAEYVTFQSDNFFSDVATSVRRSAKKWNVLPAVELLAPFTRTPSNVIKAITDYSPVGVAQVLIKQLGSGYEQKKLSEAIGRGVTGSALIALGGSLAAKGLLRTAKSEDSKVANAEEAAGKLDYAVKIGDTWVQINRQAPYGNLLLVGGDLYKARQAAKEEGKSELGALGSVAAEAGFSTLRQVTDQPFLQGVSGGLNALIQPDRYAETFAERTVASVIPNIVAATARGVDPTLRDPQTLVDAVKSRIPGQSDEVLPRRTMFGTEQTIMGNTPESRDARTAPKIGKDILNALFNPIITSKEVDDPVIQAMADAKVGTPKPEKTELRFDGIEGFIKVTPKTSNEYSRVVGGWLYKFMDKALDQSFEIQPGEEITWYDLNQEQQQEIVDELYSTAREMGDLYLQTEYVKKKYGPQVNPQQAPAMQQPIQ